MAEASNQRLRRRPQAGRKLVSRSGVWAHFSRFTDDDGNDKARCDRCCLVLGASTRNGTSTLRAHVRICWGEEAVAAAAAPSSSSRGSPSQESGRLQDKNGSGDDLARMIALHGYDPSFVEDDYFRSFVRGLNPGYEVPSRVAIGEMCDGIFDEARKDSFSRLRRAPGRVSFAVGRAKTIEAGEAMYIACHFIDDQWSLQNFVLHALLDDAEHYYVDGAILGVDFVSGDPARDVMQVISDYEHRLFVMAYDTGDKDIHPELNNFTVSEHEDRLSLVVANDITDKDIHLRLKNYIELINSPRNQSCTTTTYLDSVLHSIARCLLPDSDFTTGVFEDTERLHLSRRERLQLLSELDLDYKWACDECWCSCYFSLEFLRKRGFTKLAGAEAFLNHLCKVWEQVYRSIQRISASTSPTSNLCLLELFKLKEILQSELARFIGDEADIDNEFEHFEDGYAVNVLRKASDILDQAIQDWYLVWSVPLALDPRYKLRYIEFSFKRAFGSAQAAKYVTAVTTNINNMYADYMKEYGTITGAEHSDTANEMMDNSSADPLEQAWNEHCRSQNVMAAQVNNCYPENQTELDCYLQDRLAPATQDFDLLNWWKVHSSEYPMVARMARDALAMPTCSKLSSDQLGQVRSMLRGYSKKPYSDGEGCSGHAHMQ